MRFYLAGGAVRDLLLGKPISDRDYLVMEASREAFQQRFSSAYEVGHAFPIFLMEGMEFSFPRAQAIEDELKARDLTVNAILLDTNGELICHPDALTDLHDKTLRPASHQSFMEDPLRVFRAARFWAKLPDFTPHDSLISAMREVADNGLLESIAPDRVGQETYKALFCERPGNYLRLLNKARCLSPWFAEFSQAADIPAGPSPYHDTHVLEHTCRIMDALAGNETSVWMGLCHDLGKTSTPPDQFPSHHGHDIRGVSLVQDLTRRLRLSNALMNSGSKAARWHMTAASYPKLKPGTRVDLLMDIKPSTLLPNLFALVEADHGYSLGNMAQADLESILNVRLPHEFMNRGAESGSRLRELRASALAGTMKK